MQRKTYSCWHSSSLAVPDATTPCTAVLLKQSLSATAAFLQARVYGATLNDGSKWDFCPFRHNFGRDNYVGLHCGPLVATCIQQEKWPRDDQSPILAEGTRRKLLSVYLVKGNEHQVLDVLMVQKLKHLPVFLDYFHSVLSQSTFERESFHFHTFKVSAKCQTGRCVLDQSCSSSSTASFLHVCVCVVFKKEQLSQRWLSFKHEAKFAIKFGTSTTSIGLWTLWPTSILQNDNKCHRKSSFWTQQLTSKMRNMIATKRREDDLWQIALKAIDLILSSKPKHRPLVAGHSVRHQLLPSGIYTLLKNIPEGRK